MIRPIMKVEAFLAMPSLEAGEDDLQVAHDLLDTLAAHKDECVGMAANMIGVRKRIIAFADGGKHVAMLNPQIVSQTGEYQTREGCLSLTGKRSCTRYRSIKVSWTDLGMKPRVKTFAGWTAQIIQHEIDHCNGVVI